MVLSDTLALLRHLKEKVSIFCDTRKTCSMNLLSPTKPCSAAAQLHCLALMDRC
jgi:hypothetical protein